jgi:hypothetical protein
MTSIFDKPRRDAEEGATRKRIPVGFPKQEPPLEGAFIFPAEESGFVRARDTRKKTKPSVPKKQGAAYTIL